MANNQDINDEVEVKLQETSKQKEVLSTGISGKVKWFNVKLGYGFVCRNDNGEDIFIHQSAIVKSNPKHPRKSVGDGEEILFDIVKGNEGNEAGNVCALDGSYVKGSEYALRFPRGRGRGRGSFRGRGRQHLSSSERGGNEFYRGAPRERPFRGGRAPGLFKENNTNNVEREANPVDGKQKEVLCTAITGKVKWFNVKLGYGFVCRNDNGEDIFIHQSAIVKSNPEHPRKSVEEGEEILFDIVKGTKGTEAGNVSALDGNCVKGSEYALRYPRGRGRGRGAPRGRGRPRGLSEEMEMRTHDFYRGGPRGRPFRGGRPFSGPYNYEMPPQYFYEFDFYRGPMRGGPRGGRIFRGGPPPRDAPMQFDSYEGDFFERRPRGRGRPRSRGRGRGRGRGMPRDNVNANNDEHDEQDDSVLQAHD